MRTRNRGQRTSFVSSLGLCPRKNRRKPILQRTTLALSGHASRGRRFRKRSMLRSTLLSSSGIDKSMRRVKVLDTPNKSSSSPSKTSPKCTHDNSIVHHRPPVVFRGRRRGGPRGSARGSILSRPSRTAVGAGGARSWRRGRKRKFLDFTVPVSVDHSRIDEDVRNEMKFSSTESPSDTPTTSSRSNETSATSISRRLLKRRSSRIDSPYIYCLNPRRGSYTTGDTKVAVGTHLSSKFDSSTKQPVNSVPLHSSQHVSGKRKRGRPPSPAVHLKSQINSISVVSNAQCSTLPTFVSRSSFNSTTLCTPPSRAIASVHPCYPATANPSTLCPEDLRSRTGDLRFGSADEVLLEILREVDTNGCVPKVQKPSNLSCSNLAASKDESSFESEGRFVFDTPLVATVFEEMLNPCSSVFGLEVKDLFLAINGLVRPGVCDLWRRRREDKTKQLSRSVMGRLRPNPRPRLYSDMIIPGGSGQGSAHVNVRHVPLETVHFSDKVRQSSRSVVLAAARLTAAKRLIRARSHQLISSTGTLLMMRVKKSRSTKVDTTPAITSHNDPEKTRPRRTTRLSSQVVVNTRARRRPDVRHHIDWKFCYTNTDQENLQPMSFSNILSHRRRKAAEPVHISIPEDANAGPRSVPVLPSEGTPCTDLEESKSVSEVKREEKGHVLISEVSEETAEVAKPEMELARSEIEASALSVPSCDGRRKRRHALTVQRKRPTSRSVGGFYCREENSWKDRYSLSTKFEDNSSVSSSSASGTTTTFGRGFRHSDWPQNEHSKSSSSRHSKSICGRSGTSTSFDDSKSTRSLSARKPQRLSGSVLVPRRTPLSVRVAPAVSPRQRITRRPDRMCQLTLLDRLVLGLNCSVSRNGGEIHIKQLHAEELNILTQRMNKTGFFIQSLALRTNSHNDAEYNLVLTFSPTAEGVTRRTRCPSSTRSRVTSSDYLLDYPSYCYTERIPCRKQRDKSRSLRHKRSCLPGIADTKGRMTGSRQSSQNSGYFSDSALSFNHFQHRLPVARYVHSDGEDSDPVRCYSKVDALNLRKLSVQKPSQCVSTCKHMQIASAVKHDGASGNWSPRNLDSQIHCDVGSPASNRRSSTSHPERFLLSSDCTGGHRRSTALAKIEQERTFESESPSCLQSPPNVASDSSLGTSKRTSRINAPALSVLPPFRRHSPRKIIRKVYTGSLTIPKILNRKRQTGGPSSTSSSSVCSSVTTANVPCLVSSSFSQHISTTLSAVPPVSTQLSTNVHSVNNAVSSIVHEEANHSLPIFSNPSSSTVSVQYRRLPAVTSVSIIPPVVVSESSTLSFSQTGGVSLAGPSMLDDRPVEVDLPIPPHLGTSVSTTPSDQPTVKMESESGNTQYNFHECTSTQSPRSATFGSSSLSAACPFGATNDCSPREPVLQQIDPNQDPVTSESTYVSSASDVPSISHPPDDTQNMQVSITEPLRYPLPVNTKSSTGTEPSMDVDDTYTPATSMSASQLLKLKRLHDENGRPLTQTNENRPNQFLSPSGRVQSPLSSLRPAPSQQNNTEGNNLRGRQATEPERSQEGSSQYGPVSSANSTNCSSSLYSVPLSVDTPRINPSLLPLVPCENEDTDDFELKAVAKSIESSVEYAPFPSSSTTLFTEPTPTHITFQPPLDTPLFSTGSGLSASVRVTRPAWPVMRTGLTISRPPTITFPVSSSGVTVVHTVNPVRPQIFETLTPNQVATRVMVQNPASATRFGDLPTPSDSAVPITNVNIDGTISTLGFRPIDAPMRSYNFSSLAQSTGLPVITGPNKRTVVHKYHSFRKILPKSPEHPGSVSGTLAAPTSSLTGFPTLTTQSRLTHVPVVASFYRSGPVSRSNTFAYDSLSNPSCIGDFTSNLSVVGMRHKPIEHVTFSLGVPPNPASQLLKSLLESSDSKDSVNNHLPPVSTTIGSTTSSELHGSSTSSAPVARNQLAHQSRGTWQLGKRVVSTTQHRTQAESGNTINSPRPQSSASSNVQPHGDNAEVRDSRLSDLSGLPSPIRLVPGSTSRLQQLQQHYQRRQQLQLEQQHQPKQIDRAIPSDAH